MSLHLLHNRRNYGPEYNLDVILWRKETDREKSATRFTQQGVVSRYRSSGCQMLCKEPHDSLLASGFLVYVSRRRFVIRAQSIRQQPKNRNVLVPA